MPHPLAKLIALLLMLWPVMASPVSHPAWLLSVGLFLLLLSRLKPPFKLLLALWFKLRWLLLGVALLHLLLTPGEPLLPGLPEQMSKQGLLHGLDRVIRLLLLSGYAWLFNQTTTAAETLNALRCLAPKRGPLSQPMGRFFDLLGFTLLAAPRMLATGRELDETLAARVQRVRGGRMQTLFWGWYQRADVLLNRLLSDLPRHEEALIARGWQDGLPKQTVERVVWRMKEWGVVSLPFGLVVLGVVL
uniref:Cobalt transport protein n=1 Tax=Magnetococcus massalia (strain MO-1) TaxID=451514 RepID=A0A1S7LHC5_MAGMO|nr:conserved exported protein of unknown function. Containing cobalt (Co) ion transmembrane transporter activity domain. might involve in the cobalamin biosynthetic process [Candidatus Magnetococcus massalia]